MNNFYRKLKIKTEKEYRETLTELKRLLALDPDPNTAEGNELEVLTLLVEQYESETYHFDTPDPIEAILFRMEQQELSQYDLVQFLGSPTVVADVLNRKRPLTLEMIRALHAGLGLPAHVLIQAYSATPN